MTVRLALGRAPHIFGACSTSQTLGAAASQLQAGWRTQGYSSKAPADLRVAIVGGGVGGPVLAMLLKKHLGCTPVVFEAVHAIKEVGAGISLAPNGLRVLDSVGLSPSLVQRIIQEPMDTMQVTAPDDSSIVTFPTLAQKTYGLPMTGVRRFRLLNALHEGMEQMGIPLMLGKRLADINQHSSSSSTGPATLLFEDGSCYEDFDLVVGCDGLRSHTRALVKGGSEPPPTYTGDEIVFAVTCDRNHDLVPANTCRMVFGPGNKHFGSYGLGPDCSWFTVVRRDSSSDTWGPVADAAAMEEVKEELAATFKGWKLVQRMLERDVTVMIRVGVFDRDPTPVWTKGAVTLLGDAASPIPPNLGQGGNKALEDAGVLTHCLLRHNCHIPAALQQYQQLRSRRAADLLKYSRQAQQVGSMHNPLAIAARNVVLRSLVAVTGTIPSHWMWEYECAAAVQQA